MTAAFTSDAKSRWAAEWMTWPGYGKFWTQVIRQIMRKSDTRGIQVQTARHADQATIAVDAMNEVGQFLNDAEVELTVINPQLRRNTIMMSQSAPGRYAADTPLPQSGSYHLEIAVKQNGQTLYRQSRGMMRGYSDELRIRPTNEELLREVASASGGQFNPTAAECFASTTTCACLAPDPALAWTADCSRHLVDPRRRSPPHRFHGQPVTVARSKCSSESTWIDQVTGRCAIWHVLSHVMRW